MIWSILSIVGFLAFFVFSIGLLYWAKNRSVQKLYQGVCPECGAQNSLEDIAIVTKVLNSSGCSGVAEVEYRCLHCDYSTIIKTTKASSCSF